MYLASSDIKTAFDEEDHNTHGWLISALLREMSRSEGQAMFECVEAPRLWQKMATQLLANVDEILGKKRMGALIDLEKDTPDMQHHVGRELLDHVPFPKSLGTNAEGSDSGS